MKKLSLTLLLASIIGFSSSAKADLLIEPLIGYSLGKSEFDFTFNQGTDTDSQSIKGPSYGGRLGYQNLGFQLGVDYLASNMDFDGDDFKTSELGGFVGFEFPILFRVYVGYVFSGKGELSSDDVAATTVKFEKGTGPKFGIGFTLLPFLDINLEHRMIKYDTYSVGDVNNTKIDHSYSATMLSFSLPFTI